MSFAAKQTVRNILSICGFHKLVIHKLVKFVKRHEEIELFYIYSYVDSADDTDFCSFGTVSGWCLARETYLCDLRHLRENKKEQIPFNFSREAKYVAKNFDEEREFAKFVASFNGHYKMMMR